MSKSSISAEDKVKKFFASQKEESFNKNDFIIKAGAEPEHIYYLLSGQVRQFDISKHGDEVVLNVFKPGTYFPMSHAFNPGPSKYYFQASSDVSVQRADIKTTYEFVTSDSEILSDLLKRVFKGTDGLLKRMSQLMGGNSKTRFVQEILLQAQRFGIQTNDEQPTQLPLNVTELAARTGITRETASRITSELRSEGLIKTYDGHFYINDIADLEKLLQTN